MSTLRELILTASDAPALTKVEVPEWGTSVYIRVMSGRERDSFESSLLAKAGKGKREVSLDNVRAKLLVRVIADENGNRIFKDSDADALGAKSGKVLDRLYDAAQRANGVTEEDVEELAKN